MVNKWKIQRRVATRVCIDECTRSLHKTSTIPLQSKHIAGSRVVNIHRRVHDVGKKMNTLNFKEDIVKNMILPDVCAHTGVVIATAFRFRWFFCRRANQLQQTVVDITRSLHDVLVRFVFVRETRQDCIQNTRGERQHNWTAKPYELIDPYQCSVLNDGICEWKMKILLFWHRYRLRLVGLGV